MQKILKRFFVLVCVLLMFILSAHATTLPNGYTQLEYIESTGTQYIDTNYIFPSTGDVEINGQFMYVGQQVEKSMFGCQRSGDTISPLFWIRANGKLYFYIGKSLNVVDDIPFNYDTVNTFHIKTTGSNYELQFNNNSYSGTFTQGWPSQWSFALFGNHYDNPWQGQAQDNPIFTQLPTAKLYSFKMKVGGNIVMDFVPVKRNFDGVLGMYDLVNNKFYTNAGSGTFIAGPVVNTCTYTTMLGTQVCLSESQPTGSYLVVRQNGNKYYINLSVENDALNPKTITSESNNVLRIKVGNTTYNAHDTSVNETTL